MHRLYACALALLIPIAGFAQIPDTTDVSGTIGSAIWDVAGSPYRLTGAVTLPVGATLVIDPGVEVLFTASAELVVNGAFHAVGTEIDSILFLGVDSAAWNGIELLQNDTSTIAFARISGASSSEPGALYISESRVGLSDLVITGNHSSGGAGGLQILGSSQVTVARTLIYDNTSTVSAGGVTVTGGMADFTDCQIVENSSNGDYGGILLSNAVATFFNCDISDNIKYGTTVNFGAGCHLASATATFDSCRIDRNENGRGIAASGQAGEINFNDGSISYNTGGGAYGDGAEFYIRRSTISHNTGATNGGGASAYRKYMYIYDSVISDNIASSSGGGFYTGSASGTYGRLYRCDVFNNSAYNGGGVFGDWYVYIQDCVIAYNDAANEGGGVYTAGSCNSYVIRCTVVYNIAVNYGGARHISYAYGYTRNSIIQLNTPNNSPYVDWDRTMEYNNTDYSNSHSNAVGNINVDSKFVDPLNGDFRLTFISPCWNAGMPTEYDADGTRRDIGRYPLDAGTLHAPRFFVNEPVTITIPFYARYDSIYAVDFKVLTDSALFAGANVTVVSHAFEGVGGTADAGINGDTLFVSVASAMPVLLNDEPIVEISATVTPPALTGTLPFDLLPYPYSSLNEHLTGLTNGVVELHPPYGDVTADGTISALDAAMTLSWIVRNIAEIDTITADVTANGVITAYDAAYMLMRVIYPELVFPAELSGNLKPARSEAATLSWVERDGVWSLIADRGEGIDACELTVRAPSSGVSIEASGQLAWSGGDGTVRIAIARPEVSANELVRITGLTAPPEIASVSLNEGLTPVVVGQPMRFSLAQNAPNPFNPSTTIHYTLPDAGAAHLAIYSISGQLVRVLTDEPVEAGPHAVIWNGRDGTGRQVASGVYFYRLQFTGADGHEQSSVRRMVLLR